MTPFETWLNTTPIPLIAVVLLILMLATASAAALLRRAVISRSPRLPGGTEGYIVSGVLGLLALLTSFTFAIAVDRYEVRRHLILDEANAIGTAYLRAQLLPDPHRARLSDALSRYTDNRIALAVLRPGEEQDRRLTLVGPGRRLALLLHHDDPDREVTYDRDFRLSPLVEALDEAKSFGLTVVSMARDWTRVFV